MNDYGERPTSVVLSNDKIFTITSIGILLSSNEGTFISNLIHPNISSIVELTKFPNGKIASYNGAELSLFTEEGVYERQLALVLGNRVNIMDFTSIINHNDNQFLIATTDSNKMKLYLIHTRSLAIMGNVEMPINSSHNVQCTNQIKGNGFLCAVIEDYFPELLFVYVLDLNLIAINQVSVESSQGRYLKLKHIDGYSFWLCYLTYLADAYCNIFNESMMILRQKNLIVASTDNFSQNQFDFGALSKKELLFVYVDNLNNKVNVQKVSSQGALIGRAFAFPLTGMGYMHRVNYLSFLSGKKGVVYGHSGGAVYFQEIDIPNCFDYCKNVGYSTTTLLDFTLYSSTKNIRFSVLPVFGALQSLGIPLVISSEYSITAVSYVSPNFLSLASGKFYAVNRNGLSIECSLNIFVGEKAYCPCPDNTYLFQDTCVLACPDYTYVDVVNMQCINCASLTKFLYRGQCKSQNELPDSVFIENNSYNVVKDCTPPCRTCADSATNCKSCQPGTVCSLKCNNDYIYSIADGKCVPCYASCASCFQVGNLNDHYCLACKTGFEPLFNNPNNCYKSCNDALTSRWYIDGVGQYQCISSTICPSTHPIYISGTNQCVESCSKSSSCIKCRQTIELLYNHLNFCVANCPFGFVPNEKLSQCDKVSGIDIGISDKPLEEELGDLNSTLIPPKNITIIRGDNYTVEIYNSTNQGGNLALSQIDFSKCEKILREEYSIPEGEVIVFVKIDLDRREELTNQVEYEVYDSKRKKLDLKYCEDTTLDVTYFIKNSSVIDIETAKHYEELGIDIYNPNDPFFVDICFPFSTENGTDIILRDRLKDIYQNISLCEQSCSYKGVDLTNLTVTCTCSIKPEVNTKITANFFTEGVTSVFTNSNFKVVTCYNLVFDSNIIVANVGFWFYLVYVLLHLPNWIYFFIVGVSPIRQFVSHMPKSCPNRGSTSKKAEDYISSIIEEANSINEDAHSDINKFRQSRRNSQLSMNTHNNLIDEKNPLSPRRPRRASLFMAQENIGAMIDLEKRVSHRTRNSNEKQMIIDVNSNTESNTLKTISQMEAEEKGKTPSNYLQSDIKIHSSQSKRTTREGNSPYYQQNIRFDKPPLKKTENKMPTQTSIETEFNFQTMSDLKSNTKKPSMETLDDFTFEEALLFDNRSFIRQFYICLKNKHSLLVTFVLESHFELRCILIIVYLFESSMDFAFNAFFFTDELISKRYNYEGTLYFLFTLQTNFIISLASFAVCFLISFLLNLLSSSKNKLEQIVSNPIEKKEKDKLLKKSLRCLRIKLVFYLISELLLVLFFWYYVTAFCAVYQNSQWSWFTGGCMTFALGLLFPFIICLCLISLRYLALLHKKKCVFRFSQWWFRL